MKFQTKLSYDNPPNKASYKDYRDFLAKVSNQQCCYCGLHETDSPCSSFEIDHFRPKSLFPSLENDVNNLRYSCRKCNSYKSKKWISNESGCGKNCSVCTNHVCEKDIERFFDVLKIDPNNILAVDNQTFYVHAIDNNKQALYTISELRLNRSLLVNKRKELITIEQMIETLKMDKNFFCGKIEKYKKMLESPLSKDDLYLYIVKLLICICEYNLVSNETIIKNLTSIVKV